MKYIFCECDYKKSILGFNKGHYDIFLKLPMFFDFKELSVVISPAEPFDRKTMKSIKQLKAGSIKKLDRLGTSIVYGETYLGIKAIGSISKFSKLIKRGVNLNKELNSLRKKEACIIKEIADLKDKYTKSNF